MKKNKNDKILIPKYALSPQNIFFGNTKYNTFQISLLFLTFDLMIKKNKFGLNFEKFEIDIKKIFGEKFLKTQINNNFKNLKQWLLDLSKLSFSWENTFEKNWGIINIFQFFQINLNTNKIAFDFTKKFQNTFSVFLNEFKKTDKINLISTKKSNYFKLLYLHLLNFQTDKKHYYSSSKTILFKDFLKILNISKKSYFSKDFIKLKKRVLVPIFKDLKNTLRFKDLKFFPLKDVNNRKKIIGFIFEIPPFVDEIEYKQKTENNDNNDDDFTKLYSF